jgi:hypothetical protein
LFSVEVAFLRARDVKRAIADAEEAARSLRAELDHAKELVACARARMGLPPKDEALQTDAETAAEAADLASVRPQEAPPRSRRTA